MVGAHIRVLKEGRWIHAVDCGDETVLHLVDEAPPPRVRRAYRPEFVAGAAAVEVVLHRERTFPPKEIVKRAYSRASDPALAAMFHDSEAFADWCTTGRLAGARNVAIEVPGVAPAPAPAPKARKAAVAKASAPKPAARKAPKAKAKVKVKAKAKPARKAPARKPARVARKAKAAPRKAKAPAKRGAKAARKGRR
jgi:hypothetical protein